MRMEFLGENTVGAQKIEPYQKIKDKEKTDFGKNSHLA
jgi:hypothetical protein